MPPSTLRTVWQGCLVAAIAAAVTEMLYSQWWKACCRVTDDVVGLVLFPGYLIAWTVGGGPHGAGKLAFYFGMLAEFLLIWWLGRLIIRKIKKLRDGGMPESVSSEPFHALVSALSQGGFAAHGQRLENVLSGTWTTSSELIGELGQVVVAVRRECKPLSAAQKALVKQCLREVRKAWPGFGLLSWLPFRGHLR